MPEEAQHRQHTVDGAGESLRRFESAACIHLTKRQEVEQEVDEDAGIAAGVAAVRKNLTSEFASKMARRLAQEPLEAVAAKPRVAERRRGEQALVRNRSRSHALIEVAD